MVLDLRRFIPNVVCLVMYEVGVPGYIKDGICQLPQEHLFMQLHRADVCMFNQSTDPINLITMQLRKAYLITIFTYHNRAYYAFYAHLERTLARTSDDVREGKLLGFSGAPGVAQTSCQSIKRIFILNYVLFLRLAQGWAIILTPVFFSPSLSQKMRT